MLSSKQDIGRFDRKVTLMQKVSVSSVSGGPKYSGYEPIDNDSEPWARWENRLGNEIVQSDQITHIQNAKVTLRYRTDLTTDMVVVKDNKMYSILSVSEDGETRRRFTVMTVEFLQDYVLT